MSKKKKSKSVLELPLSKILQKNCVDVSSQMDIEKPFYVHKALNQQAVSGELKRYLSTKKNSELLRIISDVDDETTLRFCGNFLNLSNVPNTPPQVSPIIFEAYEMNLIKALFEANKGDLGNIKEVKKLLENIDTSNEKELAQAIHKHHQDNPVQLEFDAEYHFIHQSPFTIPVPAQTAIKSMVEFSQFINKEEIFQAVISKDMVSNLALTEGYSGEIRLPSENGFFIFELPSFFDPNQIEKIHNTKYLLTYQVDRAMEGGHCVFFNSHILFKDNRIGICPSPSGYDVNPETLEYTKDGEKIDSSASVKLMEAYQNAIIEGMNPNFSQDEASHLFQNLIDNLCLYVTSHPEWIERKTIDKKPLSGLSKKKRKIVEQQNKNTIVHIVDIPKSIESRKTVKTSDFEKADVQKNTKRFLVRGHWRQQAHGVGRKERKLIFIAPFWKGIENGTLIEKSYQVSSS